jgi:anti-sigma-K factor RskA
MEPQGIHELTAAYALQALDEHEVEAYEAHLRHCPRCRDDLVELREAATTLAYAAPAASPPPALRARILDQARAERSNVVRLPVRLRDRRSRILTTTTAVAAAAAIALGIWAAILHGDLDSTRSARARDAQALALLAAPGSRQVPLSGASGSLVIGRFGRAVLVISGLPPAPTGKTYEAWVIRNFNSASPAGLFRGGGRTVFQLSRPIANASSVAVTVERNGGATKPSTEPIFSAQVSNL